MKAIQKGALKPLEKLGLKEGEEVIATLKGFAGFKDEAPRLLLGLGGLCSATSHNHH
ncbi:MAG: hypothetical protein DRJ68_03385 [Thermoprotei archaeon]|nr:MAG: hypothetical protein DRJ62_00830 [Thermoprotei archaeon]RLF21482.1 MAG: hypothetical protein DRJ68_03385 [Thermoprotei archaeon]